MPRYNHACSIAFEVISDDPDGNDITPAMLKTALERRIQDVFVDSGEWAEACLPPYDTHEEPDDA